MIHTEIVNLVRMKTISMKYILVYLAFVLDSLMYQQGLHLLAIDTESFVPCKTEAPTGRVIYGDRFVIFSHFVKFAFSFILRLVKANG